MPEHGRTEWTLMKVVIDSLVEGAERATGVVAAIDVFRAFTSAAVALANGASRTHHGAVGRGSAGTISSTLPVRRKTSSLAVGGLLRSTRFAVAQEAQESDSYLLRFGSRGMSDK